MSKKEKTISTNNDYTSLLKLICKEDVPDDMKEYFDVLYKIYKRLNKCRKLKENNLLDTLSLEDLQKLNRKIYKELVKENPLFMDNKDELHIYMSVLLYSLNSFSRSIFTRSKLKNFDYFIDMLLKILPFIKEGNVSKVKEIYTSYMTDETLCKVGAKRYVKSLYINEDSFENTLVNTADLNIYDYLYKYGLYVSETQLKIVDYFNKVDYSKIIDMAQTTIDGFMRGIKNQNLDISNKTFVKIYYPLGFEKVALEAQNYLFKTTGLKSLLKVTENVANKQIDYSHRNNQYLILSKEYLDLRLNLYDKYLKKNSEEISSYAGRIFIETFGEKDFNPNKLDIVSSTDELISLEKDFNRDFNSVYMKYAKPEETSFCIISYPSPEIDEENFEEIFDETVKLNTLDNDKWVAIQQKMIDALDEGTKVRVVGMNGNNTDIIVNLHKLNEGETNFENCTADVNIPVGEVFTSPVLKETNGTLHVSRVFLRGLEYKNLSFTFKDGMVVDYNCSNFENEKDNKDYIKENILKNYNSLPIGEFAIGTNTLAYVMARKYNIENKLDILIAEKTGPHFALGDTCYSHQEDLKFYNPDGKEIVAKDNELSSLRSSDKNDEAYFYCHTDITIPYDEVGGIYAIKEDGVEIPIIVNGKFVLEGTEELNIEGL